MENFCINHSTEKAVGLCGTCKRPACYRCALTIDQVIYCSPECFNELDPPSSSTQASARAALSDEYSDVMSAMGSKEQAAAVAKLGSDPSVILAPQSDDTSGTTILGMSPVAGHGRDGSTLIMTPGSRRSLLSSSCFFHPDTSAIVLCSKCRNPICSLCAQELPEGLACSPSCGPLDHAGNRERRRLTMFNAALIFTVVFVLVESVVLLRGIRQQWALAAARAESGTEDRDPDAIAVDPELRKAATLMQEAESLLREAAEATHPGRRTSVEPPALTAKVSRLAEKLRQAREIYEARLVDAPDPAAVKFRIDTISGLLEGLRHSDDPGPERTRKQAAPPSPDGERKRTGD